MVNRKAEQYCGDSKCDLYDCTYHYSNAPWNELIMIFTPNRNKEKQCKDYKKEK